ncbi:unnamed protein product [Linum tenue]|uniref:Uncharacterized protein n=1 Tax=Linum tenue TaxID=586396 RepID=A0AAV0JGM5_9ROSI|nr:unnamed protein product [Linum tenue]
MGNCLAPSKKRCQVHQVEEQHDLPAVNRKSDNTTNPEKSGEFLISKGETDDGGGGGVKVKVVLTKDELEWLMYELRVKSNKLEDALAEIERNRALKSVSVYQCWQPSLESIIESPEEVGSGRYY